MRWWMDSHTGNENQADGAMWAEGEQEPGRARVCSQKPEEVRPAQPAGLGADFLEEAVSES